MAELNKSPSTAENNTNFFLNFSIPFFQRSSRIARALKIYSIPNTDSENRSG